MRQISKVDANQRAIVEALRSAGCSVLHTHQLGKGAPDLLIGHSRPCPGCQSSIPFNYLLEIKDGEKSPSKQRLTPDEQAFFDGWRGQVEVAASIEEALRIVGRPPTI
jgi:hypothetical protein